MFRQFGRQWLHTKRPIRSHISITNSIRFTKNYATYKRFGNSGSHSNFDFKKFLCNRNTIYVGISLGAFYVYNLHEAPFTGRLRFIWLPYWLETKIGDYSYKQILEEYQNQILPSSDPLYGKVTKIMNSLLTAAISNFPDQQQVEHLKSLDWAIHVIQVDPNKIPPNAFILPNGKIFIFSSILPICHNDDGLATVLSHELSHQLAHHSLEQLSKQPFYILLLAILYSITGTSSFNSLMIEGLLKMPASRDMESEADHIGCELMARLCFNVNEAVQFWLRMNDWESKLKQKYNTSGLSFQEFFSTHPNTNKRIHDIQSWLPDLEKIKENSQCYEYQFNLFNETHRNFFKR